MPRLNQQPFRKARISFFSGKYKEFSQGRCIDLAHFLDPGNFSGLGLENSISRNIRNFLRVGFFHFSSSESYFLKDKKFFKVSVFWNMRRFHFAVSVSWNIRKFHVSKYKKSLLLRKYMKFRNIRARKFHFLKYKKFFRGGYFSIFFELGFKRALDSSKSYYSLAIKGNLSDVNELQKCVFSFKTIQFLVIHIVSKVNVLENLDFKRSQNLFK